MKNRFFTPRISDSIELRGDEFHHAVHVARSRVGEEVECFDGAGRNVIARFTTVERDAAFLEVVGDAPSREPAVHLTLALALIQLEKFELVLQKGCELGVSAFLPLITERTEIRTERVAGKRERWEKILLEAVKQSGRSRIPQLLAPAPLADALRRDEQMIVFDLDESSGEPALEQASATTLFIGPEGGFTAGELDEARNAGAVIQRLGPRRLRAETAAIAAVALFGAALVGR